MAELEPIEVTLAVTAVLERLGIEYVVGGSLATSLHGVPRSTLDVDIVADLRMSHLQDFVAALQADFFVDADMVRDAIRRRATFNLLHLATMFKVDVFVIGADELITSELARKQRMRVQEQPPASVFVATPEDMVLQKLLWYRAGGEISDRQWADLLGVIKTQGQHLDLDYLRLWAERKEVADLLKRALAEAEVAGI
ncbi:MAG: hypothetical protein JXP73_00860 [Deltaproteobacteria bacterium]|jgi:hypothetical protein|nr:hypothetical protein [Deltaproteobacteria bacterium]